jgi:hypothetical protein
MTARGPALVAALLAVAIGAPAAVRAQSAAEILDDLDAVRGALGETVHLNLRVDDVSPEVLRVACETDGIVLIDAVGRRLAVGPENPFAETSARLLAVALATGPLGDALHGLAAPPGEQLLGYEALETLEGPVLGRRIGTAELSVVAEHGTWRLRQLRVRIGDVPWSVDVVRYGPAGNGWLPGELVIREAGQVRAVATVLDAAPDPGALAPLQGPAARPPVRLPRIPL